jgi:hypothetical protein
MPRHKRPRGGQPGNQNARKHGFYAAGLNPVELELYFEALQKNSDDPALTALRFKIEAAMVRKPGNQRILREGACLVAKYVISKNNFSPAEKAFVKRALRLNYQAIAAGNPELTKQIISEFLEKAE